MANLTTQVWVAVHQQQPNFFGLNNVTVSGMGFGLKSLSCALFLGFASLVNYAQANTASQTPIPTTIIADQSAHKTLQPIILNTASGIVSVNIQTPNANGLSNNHYRQFDVGNTGAVLNNNRKATNTQIAGFVQANPFMARGEATTILNQINSNHPSHLGGFIEIAGKKADVIIANPSGLVVNGAGFINAGNVHLAAANSTVNQGQLSGYQVSGNHAAKIEVNGKLNLQSTDYAALIAKTTQINDEIYAGNVLDVILGENQVNLQDNDFTKLNATNKQTNVSSASQTTNNKEQQGVALDVAALGGMYAGKIHLVGTDKGFGANNQGAVLATGTGSNGGLTLDAQGNLVNTGVMSAKDKLTVNTHNNAVQNDGTITSQQKDIQINSNHLDNTGLIQSTQTATINATSTLNNTGDIRAGVLQVQTGSLSNTKKLIQTGTGNLNINTNTLDNTDKAVIGKNLYEQTKLDAPAIPSTDQSTGGVTTSLDLANTESANNTNNNTKPNNEPNLPTANGFIIANHSLTNAGDQALIAAVGDIDIATKKLNNADNASIDVKSLNTKELTNTDSKIALYSTDWQLSKFDNNKGELTTKHNMAITSQSDLTNTQGRLASGGEMVLSTAGKLINHQGQIHSNRDLTVKAKQLDNSGQIDSITNATLHITHQLANTQTGNISAQAIDIRTKDLQNTAIITAKELSIEQTDDYAHNKQGKLLADTLKLTVQGDIHNQSSLTASKTLIVHANHIDNDQEAVIGGNQHTQIISQTNLKNQGLINGEQTLIKAANTIDNLAGGRIYGTHLAIQADTLNNTPAKSASTQDTSQASQAGNQHTAPVIAARDRLDIGVNHLNNQPNPDRVGKFNENFDNQARIISLGSLHIAGSLDDNQYATGKAKTVINHGATIESVGQMSIASQTVQNSNANYQKQNIKLDEQTKPNQVFYRPKSTTHEYPESQVVLGSTSRGLGDAVLYIKDEKGHLINQGEDWHRIQKTLNTFEDRTMASDPARMVAGGNILFDVNHLTNDKSQMNAGAGSQIIGHNLSNDKDDTLVGRQIQHSTNITSQYHTVGWNRTRTRHRHNWGGVVAQADESKVLASYPLPILKASTDHQTGQENKPSATLSGVPSTLTVPPVDTKSADTSPTSTPAAISLPNSSLYLISGDNPNQPLLMTDPAFIDAKNWLSSDYMLKALQSDPSHTHKRLADGYGEQQQLSDQYQRLTGRHILGDYQNNEIAFKTLMDNGIAHAKAFHYTLGIALTPAQMANLTTDIVWLVKQTVSYESKDKDGNTITKTEEVLVPTLYQKTGNTKTGTLTKDGRYSGIAGKSIDLQLTGNLDNNGNLIAQNTTNIKADTINNNGIIQGDFVHITADQDINNQHTIYADSAASLNAGNNITNQSQTITHQHQKGQSSSSDTQISQIASIKVGSGLKDKTDDNGKPLTTLTIKAGNHILYKAANTQNAGGSTQITANNGINISTITTSNQINAIGDDNNYFKHSQSTDVGSSIVSHGNLTLATTADQADITATAANLQSGGTTAIVATGGVRFEAGRHIDTHEDSNKLSNNSLVKKQTEQNRYKAYNNTSIQNQIGGENVLMKSGGNMTLVVTDVLADKDIVLNSAGSMTIASAANTQSTHEYSQIDKKGLFSTAPTSVTLGKQRTQSESGSSQTTYTGSLIGTTGGNITMMSGDSLNVINSDIIAQKDQNSSAGNIYLQATDATITSQNKTSDTKHRFAQKTTGITASVSSSLVGDVQSIETLEDATQDTNSRRAKLMGGLAAASKAYTLAQNLQNGNLGSIRVQATAGSQSTKKQTLVHQEENDAANIHADNHLIINLKGKGKNSDLVVTGSNISVGNNLYQNVEGDVIYQASTQTDTTDSQNSSKGWGVGIYASAQIGGGNASQGFTVNANKAKGNSTETTITHTNTQVTVKGSTINNIGGNLTLDGANLDTKHLTGTVGGDLIVKSRQDSYQYTHDQKQAGFSADVGFNGKPQSININGGKTDIDASYKQVTHQSGITAKESTLQVQGQGNFTGGYLITDAGKNQTQFAQGITTESLENHLNYQGDAISVGIGIGANTSSPDGKAKPALQGLGYGKIDPVHKTSTTHSAITDQAGLSHINTENFNQAEVQNELNEIIDNSFNQEQALKELNAQVSISTEFGREAPKAMADFSKDQIKRIASDPNLTPEEKITEQQKWAEGGVYRVALHTAVGAIGTGAIEGAVTTGSIAASAPIIDKLSKQITKQLIKAGISENAAQNATSLITSLAIATATQSAGVDISSTAMAVNADAFNRQLHPDEMRFILDEDRVKEFAEKYGLSIEEAETELIRVAAAYKGKDWATIYDLRSYDTDGKYKGGNPAPRALTYIWSKLNHEERKAFNHNDEYYDPKINLRKLFDEIEDVKIQRAVEILYVPVHPQVAQSDFILGGQLGASQANMEASLKNDLQGLIPDPQSIFQYIKNSLISNEVGAYDDQLMQSYYENLLRIQGKYKDLGCIQGKDWNETQRQIGVSGIILPLSGVSSSIVRITTSKTATQESGTRIENNVNFEYGDYVLPTGRQVIDPTRTSFSQVTVSYQKMENGVPKDYNYDSIVTAMKEKQGLIDDPVDVVNMPDKAPTSMDNTRILAAREAGVKVEAIVHNFDDPIPLERAEKLIYQGKIPKTWGEAIQLRVQKQSEIGSAFKEWPSQYPNGSIYDPKITYDCKKVKVGNQETQICKPKK